MVWLILLILLGGIIGLFTWANISAKAERERRVREDPASLYPFFGVFTDICEYRNSLYEKEAILVNTETGKIAIKGSIYNISEITKCEAKDSDGGMVTTYEEKTYIKPNMKSVLGRAIVGGVVGGGVGAVIGASTANKEIKTEREEKHYYVGKSYCLRIYVNGRWNMQPIFLKSREEMMDVYLFINDIITEYRSEKPSQEHTPRVRLV